jgi:hypothetical protein
LVIFYLRNFSKIAAFFWIVTRTNTIYPAVYDVSRFLPGTFFTVIFNPENGDYYLRPSEGAKYINGVSVPDKEIVTQRRGHYDLAVMYGGAPPDFYSDLPPNEPTPPNRTLESIVQFRGGGFILESDGSLTVKYRSRSLNGVRLNDGYMPSTDQIKFLILISQITGRKTKDEYSRSHFKEHYLWFNSKDDIRREFGPFEYTECREIEAML